jgi:hypothetical protein
MPDVLPVAEQNPSGKRREVATENGLLTLQALWERNGQRSSGDLNLAALRRVLIPN